MLTSCPPEILRKIFIVVQFNKITRWSRLCSGEVSASPPGEGHVSAPSLVALQAVSADGWRSACGSVDTAALPGVGSVLSLAVARAELSPGFTPPGNKAADYSQVFITVLILTNHYRYFFLLHTCLHTLFCSLKKS